MPGEPWEVGQRAEFRGRFGEDVDAYDKTRPVAPDIVFDDLVRLAGLGAGSSVVEIGPGTGQATYALATRRLRIVALEVDGRLAQRAARNLAGFPQVSVQTVSFEAWDPGAERFDAVVAFNSFHWIDPAVGLKKAAGVLKPHGHFIVVSTPLVVPDGASRFWWDVQDDWAAASPGRLDPATQRPELVEDWAAPLRESELFHAATATRHLFDVTFTADEYADYLSTQSGVKQLPEDAQAPFLERVRQRVRNGGDRLVVHHLAVLTAAQKSS